MSHVPGGPSLLIPRHAILVLFLSRKCSICGLHMTGWRNTEKISVSPVASLSPSIRKDVHFLASDTRGIIRVFTRRYQPHTEALMRPKTTVPAARQQTSLW